MTDSTFKNVRAATDKVVHRLSADNRYPPIIGQFASVTNLRSYHFDFTIVTI